MKKNFLSVVVAICLWALVLYVVVTIDPEIIRDVLVERLYLPFFGLLGVAFWYTFAMILRGWLRGLIVAIYVLSQLYLQVFGILDYLIAIVSICLLVLLLWLSYQRNVTVVQDNTFDSKSGGDS